ncbi:MAG: hypothetical protein CL760_04860 [Chloroflexi bacterium]|nr:hypothetical protein [Chloroflexota bacterium]
MILFKACKKCHGDVSLRADLDEDVLACLQCGLVMTDIDKRLAQLKQIARMRKQFNKPLSGTQLPA